LAQFDDHCANSVKFAVWPCAYGNVIAVPPVDAVNQPLKTYPVRVGVPGELIDAPVVVVVLSIALPSCSFVVTVNVFADHCANSVKFAV